MAGTRLEIDLDALRHNYTYMRSKIAIGIKMMGVVKAFGYGSDASIVALELEKLGIDYFAVAYAPEGVTLRKAGVQIPILVLHPQPDNFELIVAYQLEPSIYSHRVLSLFSAFIKKQKQTNFPIHLKFNTGLNRLGFLTSDVGVILERFRESATLKVKSIFSHLAASEDLNEKKFTKQQILDFEILAKDLISGLGYIPFLHETNTSGVINYPEAHFDCVRIGIGLYGYGNTAQETEKLLPVASLKSVISQIHHLKKGDSVGYNRAFIADSDIVTATLPIGHADGISRALGNGIGYVTISGRKAPIVGNVCMDMLMIDVTGIACQEGTEVEFFGKNTNAETFAQKTSSISYEVLTSIGQRIKRSVVKE